MPLPLTCANYSLESEYGKVGTLVTDRIWVFLNPTAKYHLIPCHHKLIEHVIQSLQLLILYLPYTTH